jgi:hypothetical protein
MDLEDIYNAEAVPEGGDHIEINEETLDYMDWLPEQLNGFLTDAVKERVNSSINRVPFYMTKSMLTYIVCNEPKPRELSAYIANECCIWHDDVTLLSSEATCLFYFERMKQTIRTNEKPYFFKHFRVEMLQTIFTIPEDQVSILRKSIEVTKNFTYLLDAKSIVGRDICLQAIKSLDLTLVADLQNKFFAGKFDEVQQTLGDILLDSSVISGCVDAINNGYQYKLVSRLFLCVPDRKSMQKILSKVEHPSYRAMYETSAKKLAINIIESFEAHNMCKDIALLCMSYVCNNAFTLLECLN